MSLTSDRLTQQQAELADFIERHTGQDGTYATAVPTLFLTRRSNVTGPNFGVYNTSLCMVVQGRKEVHLGQQRLTYGPDDCLVASADLPVAAQVVEASADTPYLSLKLEFTPSQVIEVLRDSDIRIAAAEKTARAMYVGRLELALLDAVLRLVRLLDSPGDIALLAPLYIKEILYRVLQGPYGTVLGQVAAEGSCLNRIREVIGHIVNNFNRPLRIESLAELGSFSVSSLHRHFKEVTAMSPLQFQKHLRLQEARRLLLSESADAAEVAFRVGYESPSQFSREYSRMFGLSPIQDVRRLRAMDA